jgi:hypothetical protein
MGGWRSSYGWMGVCVRNEVMTTKMYDGVWWFRLALHYQAYVTVGISSV